MFKRKSVSQKSSGGFGRPVKPSDMNNRMKDASTTILLDENWNEILTEAQNKAAAESLQIRLKADLRPGFVTNDLRQIRMVEPDSDNQPSQHDLATIEKKRRETVKERMPSLGIRKISNMWGDENVFNMSESSKARPNDQSSAVSPIDSLDSQDSGSGRQDDAPEDMETFSSVATIRIPEPRGRLTTRKSAPWPNEGPHHHPHGKPFQTIHRRMSSCFRNKRPSTAQAVVSTSSRQSGGDGRGEPSDEPVVVARAECALAHPRPWRLSETRMLEDLVAGQTGARRQEARQRSRTSSQSEALSFHTAREDSG